MLINKMLVPSGLKNNPNQALREIAYITVHETGNYNVTATAKNHALYQLNGSGGRQASWYYTVDENEIWQSFEDWQRCWHCGDGNNDTGNATSIGLEICLNSRDGYIQACLNAAWLVSELMHRHGIPLINVVPHQKWSGKACPENMLRGAWGVTYESFLDSVGKLYAENANALEGPLNANTEQVHLSGIKIAHGGVVHTYRGHITDNTAYVEVRRLLENLGFMVGWDGSTSTVTVGWSPMSS